MWLAYLMLLLCLQFRCRALPLDWTENQDVTRQSWCGTRSPNAAGEASSPTTRYSIQAGQSYIVCTCRTVSEIALRLQECFSRQQPSCRSYLLISDLLICRRNSASQRYLTHSDVIVRQHQVRHLDHGFNHPRLGQRLQSLIHHSEIWWV